MIKNLNTDNKWKKINYRTIVTALGMEFLHDLYNRHFSNVNSIRFRNTLLYCKGTEVSSYAPTHEWDFLAKWFGERFIRGESDLWEEVESYIADPKEKLKKVLKKIKLTDINEVDDMGLGLMLIDFHYIVLSVIYKINLVQIEHALNYAINQLFKKYFKDENKRNEIISSLIFSKKPTVAILEKRSFFKIVILGLNKKIDKIKTNDHSKIHDLIKKHYNQYRYVHSAYGAKPYNFEYYIKRYNILAKHKIKKLNLIIKELDDSFKKSLNLKMKYYKLIKNDKILKKNIDLITKIGTLRDKNKALLGTTIEIRENIFKEISKRKKINLDKLNYYFLVELCDLLSDNKKVKDKEIQKRKKGVVIYRKEYVSTNLKTAQDMLNNKSISNLKGVCASKGDVKGIVKIINNIKDVYKMTKGDIMVAKGTDFDLIGAMQIASGIITEEGGLLSHASVICRERGIPCIIGVENATNLLKDGNLIQMSSSKGCIKIIKGGKK
jgi:phosphohistidine swiveling domain-containing protein